VIAADSAVDPSVVEIKRNRSPTMTFSIAAFDPDTASWGVAVASKCLAVGHAVPWGSAGKGAIATQALANLSYGPNGLMLLADGDSAASVVEKLVGPDDLAAQRQLGVVDASGGAANHTGSGCLPWAGGLVDGEVTVQGNILAGSQVLDAMLEAYRASSTDPFARRLFKAVEAGENAGGDRRGKQSSCLRVWREGAAYGGGLDTAVDLRVDDDPEPVAELGRLLDLHHLYFERPAPGTLLDLDSALIAEISQSLTRLDYPPESYGGVGGALERWIGTENFEERHVPGQIDPLVLAHLRRQAGVEGG
jgi:uncharacterized Ntn-hydrolase superfamily protein